MECPLLTIDAPSDACAVLAEGGRRTVTLVGSSVGAAWFSSLAALLGRSAGSDAQGSERTVQSEQTGNLITRRAVCGGSATLVFVQQAKHEGVR